MLIVTDRAEQALWGRIQASPVPAVAVRICHEADRAPGDGSRPSLQLDLVTQRLPGDIVVTGPTGLEVFVEPEAADLLDDRVLDQTTDDDGRPMLVLREAA